MRLPLPKPVLKKRKSNATTVAMDKDGWVETNATKQKRKLSAKKSATKHPAKKIATKKKTTVKKRRPKKATKSRPKNAVNKIENEVIELIEDSDESDIENLENDTTTKSVRPRRESATYVPTLATSASRSTDENHFSDDDSVSEYEFE